MGLLRGCMEGRFLMSEVPLYLSRSGSTPSLSPQKARVLSRYRATHFWIFLDLFREVSPLLPHPCLDIRQSRPGSGLGSQVKVFKTYQLFPLRSEADCQHGRHVCTSIEALSEQDPEMPFCEA